MSEAYKRLQDSYGPAIADVTLIAATQNYNGVLVPRDANHTIFVQKIEGSMTTPSAGKTLMFQDSAATPVPIALWANDTPPVGGVIDFGHYGTPLTQGKSLDIRGSAAGLAGRIHIEAYQKLTGVGIPA